MDASRKYSGLRTRATVRFLRHQAADEVHLIVFRHGDDKVRLAHAGFQQDADACAVACDEHRVDGILRPRQRLHAGVDEREVVVLALQLLGNGVADLAEPDDENFHVVPLYLSLVSSNTLLNSAPMMSMVAER